ncbi:ABC transporter ATP-binding protein [Aquibium sp. A9E412]|uniref:ABC transporter ATP-binding protein n=1 Tax=Aquibium sp. A9E412 TaxID=2976767 RepID=UPI0025B07735|nr:ABC transporter ATP-binding protein [Aquibium sp. A9E412]MDN2566091.1 ABC transporter ATP-binding protein [Aquibium sp. A9E412]
MDETGRPLIEATHLRLDVPVLQTHERQLRANPLLFIRDLYLAKGRRRLDTLVEDVSFTLSPGERLGLIGRNGAGKSTLLLLLAGIYKPSGGRLVVNGSTRGLFNITFGMLPQATGLENIYLRGLQMGLSLAEIRARVPEIVAFAELEDAMDKPFSTYSSGMRMRLAFAISTAVEPDILLLDEWIGAGDQGFLDKVRGRMEQLVSESRGLVLASHNMALMRRLCTTGMVLDGGRVAFLGPIEEALAHYRTPAAAAGAAA